MSADSYPFGGLTRWGSLHQLVREQAERNGDAPAILASGRSPLLYGRLSRHVDDIVATMRSLGVGRNDRIAIVLPDGPEMAVAFLAVAAGATCAPLNPAYSTNEFNSHLAELNPRALLVLSGSETVAREVARTQGIPTLALSPTAEAAGLFTIAGEGRPGRIEQGPAQPENVALVLPTSGTTARPKLVPLTHGNLIASAHNIQATLELVASDRCLSVMPFFHIHGLSTIYASFAAGGSVVCSAGFSAADFYASLEEFRPTWYTAAPTIHQIILEDAPLYPEVIARSSLRLIRSASSAMPRRVLEDLERVFRVPFLEAYGMTEAGPQIASNRLPPRERKASSVGQAAGPEVGILDEAGHLAPPGQTGEVVIRGANVMQAYDNDPEANHSAFTQGWFRTGDQGYLDVDGYLYITGRIKEIINRGGEKISPREVEEVLLGYPAVAKVAVFALPHPTLGESVAAAIVLGTGATGGEASGGPNGQSRRPAHVSEVVRRFAATRLAPFKVPDRIVIVDEIPSGPAGKLQRARLGESLALVGPGTEPGTSDVVPRSPIEQVLAEVWEDVFHRKPIGVHDNFFALGGDSLLATRIVSRVRRKLDVELSLRAFFMSPTIEGLALHLLEQLGVTIGPEAIESLLGMLEGMTGEAPEHKLLESNKKLAVPLTPREGTTAPAAMSDFHCPRTPSNWFGRRKCNLVIVLNDHFELDGFARVAGHVHEFDPCIEVAVVRDIPSTHLSLASRPTLIFSPALLRHPLPAPGKIFCGFPLSKSEEYRALEKAGIAVPKWLVLKKGETPDLSGFADSVVRKPDHGGLGEQVLIVRKTDVRWKAIKMMTTRTSSNPLIQEFIYTGPRPITYRVNTLFGKVLYSIQHEGSAERPELAGPHDLQIGVRQSGFSIVGSARGSQVQPCHDRDIIQLGESAHAAFPEIPLLGFDIVREVPSGKLYVLEANAIGYVWNFTSQQPADYGFSFEAQYDGIRKAAYLLAEKTQECAR